MVKTIITVKNKSDNNALLRENRNISMGGFNDIKADERMGSALALVCAANEHERGGGARVRSTDEERMMVNGLCRGREACGELDSHNAMRYYLNDDQNLRQQRNAKTISTRSISCSADRYSAQGSSKAGNPRRGGKVGRFESPAWKPIGEIKRRPRRSTQHSNQPAMADLFSMEER